jgi:hypothetical protein
MLAEQVMASFIEEAGGTRAMHLWHLCSYEPLDWIVVGWVGPLEAYKRWIRSLSWEDDAMPGDFRPDLPQVSHRWAMLRETTAELGGFMVELGDVPEEGAVPVTVLAR